MIFSGHCISMERFGNSRKGLWRVASLRIAEV